MFWVLKRTVLLSIQNLLKLIGKGKRMQIYAQIFCLFGPVRFELLTIVYNIWKQLWHLKCLSVRNTVNAFDNDSVCP